MNTNLSLVNSIFVSEQTKNNFSDFEKNYLLVREKEGRVLSIDKIKRLPNVDKNYKHYKEWQIRKKNINRFLKYLSGKNKPKRILDIGCGNGFFTNKMAESGHTVVGVDVNLTELKQAAEAFPNTNIQWYYLDILKEELPAENFDLITFCASFQYFANSTEIIQRCLNLLNKNGEIHIIDSPFYNENSSPDAKLRSINHFKSMNAEGMARYYNHNHYSILDNFPHEYKYKPGSFLKKILRITDSPFPWVLIHAK